MSENLIPLTKVAPKAARDGVPGYYILMSSIPGAYWDKYKAAWCAGSDVGTHKNGTPIADSRHLCSADRGTAQGQEGGAHRRAGEMMVWISADRLLPFLQMRNEYGEIAP